MTNIDRCLLEGGNSRKVQCGPLFFCNWTILAVMYSFFLLVDTIFVINGPSNTRLVELRVFAFDGTTQRLMYSWRPKNGVS